eukprot:CAMPEP_0171102854 /NCGR_PEP_ID=MMETSP0766_2-20121228/58592_1 /TAXON_ID=439317 /ORGANISM="Gambierdiscus australes, Strain CAWD 149" /LENGTH=96 /DNA_ID=CAMNT_0011563215 /DNA_START=238 /DNA_END=524 /DNA_ORIENTATION=+
MQWQGVEVRKRSLPFGFEAFDSEGFWPEDTVVLYASHARLGLGVITEAAVDSEYVLVFSQQLDLQHVGERRPTFQIADEVDLNTVHIRVDPDMYPA